MYSLCLEKETPIQSIFLVALSSIFIGFFAQVTLPLPFTPVPLVTQNSVILILAYLLGSKRAVAAVFCFLVQGAVGLPVFAGGVGGIALLFGPTGGYLLGYLAAAFVVGYLSERTQSPTPTKLFYTLSLGNAVIFLFGVPCLAGFLGWKSALLLGCAPFLLGDILKIFIGVTALRGLSGKCR